MGKKGRRAKKSRQFCIPNFVDVEAFRSARSSVEKAECRKRFGVPEEALVVGTVAAVKRGHKRLDYLIREFVALASGDSSHRSHLLIAGSRTEESEEMVRLAEEVAPGRITIRFDLPRADMPLLYRALDVFALTSLFEMMPIAVLEAMASGLPVLANKHPVLEWMVGDGGSCIDMAAEGALAAEIGVYAANEALRRERGAAARERAEEMFSKEVVVRQMIAMYEEKGIGQGA